MLTDTFRAEIFPAAFTLLMLVMPVVLLSGRAFGTSLAVKVAVLLAIRASPVVVIGLRRRSVLVPINIC
jgi:hypothetical protein